LGIIGYKKFNHLLILILWRKARKGYGGLEKEEDIFCERKVCCEGRC
jgi:hypothetical protein